MKRVPVSFEQANQASACESPHPWWTVSQLASYYGISPRTVYQAIDAGRLSAHRFGAGRGGIRISETERQAWELNCRTNKENHVNLPPFRVTSPTNRLITKHLDL